MALIQLKLLTSRRLIPIGIDGYQIDNETKTDFIVISGESNVTEIELNFPSEIDGIVIDNADIVINTINAKGKGLELKAKTSNGCYKFSLDSRMTYRGYTKIFISAIYKNKIVRWERFDLKIHSTSPNYIDEASSQVDLVTTGKGNKVLADNGIYKDIFEFDIAKNTECVSLSGSNIKISIENNKDITLNTTPSSLSITIPKNYQHGFYSGINFETHDEEVDFEIINQNSLPVKLLKYGIIIEEYLPGTNRDVNLLIYCNGLAIYIYINEV